MALESEGPKRERIHRVKYSDQLNNMKNGDLKNIPNGNYIIKINHAGSTHVNGINHHRSIPNISNHSTINNNTLTNNINYAVNANFLQNNGMVNHSNYNHVNGSNMPRVMTDISNNTLNKSNHTPKDSNRKDCPRIVNSVFSKNRKKSINLINEVNEVNYEQLRRICREKGILYEDNSFLPCTKSISSKELKLNITWLRPQELCSRPSFSPLPEPELGELLDSFTSGANNEKCGYRSLLSAIACLTRTQKLLDRVVPSQDFSTSFGLFIFRFWRFGEWVNVIIDDRLPTHKGRLLFLRSVDPSDFWISLLEKAYAKFYGSYESYLKRCLPSHSLQDLTGGIAQSFTIPDDHIYQMISSAVSRSTLLASCIEAPSAARLRNGLLTRTCYSITGLAKVRTRGPYFHPFPEIILIRLRHPYGHGEWNGPWSERSWEWDNLTSRDREELSSRVRDNGTFWMCFDDFVRHFTHLHLVHIGPDDWMLETSLHHKRPWRAVLARRRWRHGFNSGGGPDNNTFSTNPQFHIEITTPCQVVVSVSQAVSLAGSSTSLSLSSAFSCSSSSTSPSSLFSIGFSIFEVPSNIRRLTSQFVSNHPPLDVTFTTTRETVTFFTLPPGHFIIVPSTEKPHYEKKFLLRILTDEPTNIWEVNEENTILDDIVIPKVIEIGQNTSNNLLNRMINKLPTEIDSTTLLKILKAYWKNLNINKPTIDLCRSLIILKDPNITGKLTLSSLVSLLNMLHYWVSIFIQHCHSSALCSYNYREILWESGISVSNKVLECLIIRYASCGSITLQAFLLSLVKLHLAHERYKSLQTNGKCQNLSLEEVILLTTYS